MSTEIKKKKNEVGRPSKYEGKITDIKAQLGTMKGMTDKELANYLGICTRSLRYYKKNFPEFYNAIKRGKAVPDRNVMASLYRRAVGFNYDEVSIERIVDKDGKLLGIVQGGALIKEAYKVKVTKKMLPPDVNAALAWLRVKDPENWQDMKHILIDRGLSDITDGELVDRIKELLSTKAEIPEIEGEILSEETIFEDDK